jgi:YaiO family outer membrane protein
MRFVCLLALLPGPLLAQYPRTTVELRASMDALSGGRAAWQEHTVMIGKRSSARTGGSVSAGWLERFAQVDRRIQLDGSVAAGARFTLGAEAEWSPTYAVVARSGGGVRAHLVLGKGWGIEGRAAAKSYAAADVRVGGATVERYWGSWHGAYTGSLSHLAEAPRAVSHGARLSRFWQERGIVTVGLSSGREVEALGAGVLLPMTVRSGGAWGAIPLGAHLDLTFAASVTRQGTFFTRTHTALGLRVVRAGSR